MQPKKHAALIKAWADGATIQVLTEDNHWQDRGSPGWFDGYKYRIKPEPKPDVVRYARASWTEYDDYDRSRNMEQTKTYWTKMKSSEDNVKATFDGETGELKSIEIIK